MAVKVGKELPGPHKIKAWRPGDAVVTAWGIADPATAIYGGVTGWFCDAIESLD